MLSIQNNTMILDFSLPIKLISFILKLPFLLPLLVFSSTGIGYLVLRMMGGWGQKHTLLKYKGPLEVLGLYERNKFEYSLTKKRGWMFWLMNKKRTVTEKIVVMKLDSNAIIPYGGLPIDEKGNPVSRQKWNQILGQATVDNNG